MLNKVHLIDCNIFMKDKPDNFSDLAIVDPPYGIDFVSKGQIGNSKFKAKKWDKKIPTDKYFEKLKRVSINQIIWGANYFKYIWPCKGFIFWNKLNHDAKGDGELAYTSFKIGNRYFEYMWDGNRYGTKGNIKGVGKKSVRINPCQKSVALYKWLLTNYAKPGQTIFDSHVGSGSIRIACHDMGFDFEGCELDKDYFNAQEKRYQDHIAQKDLFSTDEYQEIIYQKEL